MSEEDQGKKVNVNIGGNVEGDAHFAEGDSYVEKSGDNIKVGNISDSTGVAIGRGAQANVSMGGETEAFTAILEKLAALQEEKPDLNPLTIADAQEEVREIQERVEEGKVDEPWLERKFRSIALMGDDILDVITATATNPALGMVTIVRKVAAKAREEAGLAPVD